MALIFSWCFGHLQREWNANKTKKKWNKWEEETKMLAWGVHLFVIQKPEMFLILIILATKFIICQILK